MMPSDEKASAFLEAINKYAEQQRNEIHAEVEQFKEEELKKAEIEVLTDAYTLIQKEMAQMRKEVATEISHEEMEGKRKLFLQRRQITQEVFERAKEKLLAYTQTDTYPSLLEGYASSIAKTLTKPGTVLLVREADLVLRRPDSKSLFASLRGKGGRFHRDRRYPRLQPGNGPGGRRNHGQQAGSPV